MPSLLIMNNPSPLVPLLDFEPVSGADIKRKLSIALALGAGGALGCAEPGFVDAFKKEAEARGIEVSIEGVAGTSMGALYGAFLANDQSEPFKEFLRQIDLKTMLKYLAFPRSFSSMFGSHKIEELLRGTLGDINIEDLKIPYAAVAFDVRTRRTIHLTRGNLIKALLGSSAVPVLFPPVDHEGRLLIDGGVTSILPVAAAKQIAPNTKVIAIEVTRGGPVACWVRRRIAKAQWRDRNQPKLIVSLPLEARAFDYTQAGKLMDKGDEFGVRMAPEILEKLGF